MIVRVQNKRLPRKTEIKKSGSSLYTNELGNENTDDLFYMFCCLKEDELLKGIQRFLMKVSLRRHFALKNAIRLKIKTFETMHLESNSKVSASYPA
jgi:flagellar biosynthesis regulator FlbT